MKQPIRLNPRLALCLAAVLGLAATGGARAQDCGESYTIRSGDTLGAVAARCGTSVEALMKANPRISDPARISIGWDLEIPRAADAVAEDWARERDARAAPVLAAGRYTVEKGDSLASIATSLGLPLRDLIAANEGVDPFALRPGQELRLPAGEDEDTGEAAEVPSGDAAEASENASGATTGDPAGAPLEGEAAAVASDSAPAGAEPGNGPAGEAPESKPPREQATARKGSSTAPAADPAPERLSLEGRIRDGAECPVLETAGGDIYSLVSQDHVLTSGGYATIEAEPVEMSLCMEGQTVRVLSMSPKAPPDGG